MANQKVKTSGTGKSGHNSSRYNLRAVVKNASRKRRRAEDKKSLKER